MINALFVMTSETCDFYQSRQRIFSTGTHMIMEKGTPLLPAIDYRFVLLTKVQNRRFCWCLREWFYFFCNNRIGKLTLTFCWWWWQDKSDRGIRIVWSLDEQATPCIHRQLPLLPLHYLSEGATVPRQPLGNSLFSATAAVLLVYVLKYDAWVGQVY